MCVSSCINYHGAVQVSSRTCHGSVQTSYCRSIFSDGCSLTSHSSHHVRRHSSLVSHHRRPCMDVLVGQVLKDFSSLSYCKGSHHRCCSRLGAPESAITAFNPFAVQRHVLHRHWFSYSVCQVVAGVTQVSTMKVYYKC